MVRGYTTIEQSRKLAEILPLESADMFYKAGNDAQPTFRLHSYGHIMSDEDVCAWSLAALLGVLTKNKICHYDDRYYCQYMSEGDEFPIYSTAEYDNPVDACVKMIEKLHKLNLLRL